MAEKMNQNCSCICVVNFLGNIFCVAKSLQVLYDVKLHIPTTHKHTSYGVRPVGRGWGSCLNQKILHSINS